MRYVYSNTFAQMKTTEIACLGKPRPLLPLHGRRVSASFAWGETPLATFRNLRDIESLDWRGVRSRGSEAPVHVFPAKHIATLVL